MKKEKPKIKKKNYQSPTINVIKIEMEGGLASTSVDNRRFGSWGKYSEIAGRK